MLSQMLKENDADGEAKTKIKSFRMWYIYFTFPYKHSVEFTGKLEVYTAYKQIGPFNTL